MPVSTEQKEPQSLESVLKEAGQTSEAVDEVSEEAAKDEVAEEKPEDESKPEGVEGSEGKAVKAITFSPEQETEIRRRIDSERDKQTNSYRETHEADTAYIRSLTDQIKELKRGATSRQGSRRIEAILSGDEDNGLEEDKIKSRETALKEFQAQYEDYKDKAADVEEAAQFISTMTEKLPKDILKEFGLDDPNPHIKAVNGVKFLDETVSVFKHNQDFLMAVENFLPKGSELRKQIQKIVDGMAEWPDEKSKKLYLKDQLQGVKVTPRKKPPASSDTPGGRDWSKDLAEDKMTAGLEEERRKHKIS